ncbi:MAG: glutathione synthase [Pseudomonadota bacterium]
MQSIPSSAPSTAIRLGVIMDPINTLYIAKDSTFAMMLAAQRRGWRILTLQPSDLRWQAGRVWARLREIAVQDDPTRWWTPLDEIDVPLATLDLVLMRKDPPVDRAYLNATQLLTLAEAEGLLVVNRPQALRDLNEKLAIAAFPDLAPATLVTCHVQDVRAFLEEHREGVLKPLDGMGGRGVFRTHAGDPNLAVIVETLTHNGTRPLMAQRYLARIREGDKRILLVDGEPVPYALARIPCGDDHRGNLAAGGRGEARPLSPQDHMIAARVGPWLRDQGVWFAGLDVIGDHLTEINVTSPTCIRELDKAFGLDIAGQLLDCLAARLSIPPTHKR